MGPSPSKAHGAARKANVARSLQAGCALVAHVAAKLAGLRASAAPAAHPRFRRPDVPVVAGCDLLRLAKSRKAQKDGRTRSVRR